MEDVFHTRGNKESLCIHLGHAQSNLPHCLPHCLQPRLLLLVVGMAVLCWLYSEAWCAVCLPRQWQASEMSNDRAYIVYIVRTDTCYMHLIHDVMVTLAQSATSVPLFVAMFAAHVSCQTAPAPSSLIWGRRKQQRWCPETGSMHAASRSVPCDLSNHNRSWHAAPDHELPRTWDPWRAAGLRGNPPDSCRSLIAA